MFERDPHSVLCCQCHSVSYYLEQVGIYITSQDESVMSNGRLVFFFFFSLYLFNIFRYYTDFWSGDDSDVHSHVVEETGSSLLPAAFFGPATGIYKVPCSFLPMMLQCLSPINFVETCFVSENHSGYEVDVYFSRGNFGANGASQQEGWLIPPLKVKC